MSPHSWLDMGDRAEGRSFTLLPNSLMICLARLILDLSEAFDSVNHKVLVTRLWSTAGMGCTPFEVSGEFIPGRRVPVGSHRELLMIHVYLLGGLFSLPYLPSMGRRLWDPSVEATSSWWHPSRYHLFYWSVQNYLILWPGSWLFWFRQEVVGFKSTWIVWVCDLQSEEML